MKRRQDFTTRRPQGQPDGECPRRHRRAFSDHGRTTRLGAGRSQADQARADLRCQRPIRQQRPGRSARHHMAIDEFNAKGGVLGRKIDWTTADTETNAGHRQPHRGALHHPEHCSFLIGALHSGVANAITQVANKYGVDLSQHQFLGAERGRRELLAHQVRLGRQRHQFLQGAVKNAVDSIGKNWMLLTNDYVWGHTTSAATKAQVEGSGGKIIDNLLVPQNTRDFTAYLLKIQQAKPDVVATAIGGDDIKALREQVAQLKLEGKTRLDQQPAGLARHMGRARQAVRRVRHHLVSQAAAARRRRLRQEAGRQPTRTVADPGARQRLLQRLHGDARIAAGDRTGRLDQQRQDHQGAREPEDVRNRPHAAFRRLHRSGDAPAAADDLSGAAQCQARRQYRSVRAHQLDRARNPQPTTRRLQSASSFPTSRCRPSIREDRRPPPKLRGAPGAPQLRSVFEDP